MCDFTHRPPHGRRRWKQKCFANQLGRDRQFTLCIESIRESRAWRSIGGLKWRLLDLWTMERNALAKRAMENIRKDGLSGRTTKFNPASTPRSALESPDGLAGHTRQLKLPRLRTKRELLTDALINGARATQ